MASLLMRRGVVVCRPGARTGSPVGGGGRRRARAGRRLRDGFGASPMSFPILASYPWWPSSGDSMDRPHHKFWPKRLPHAITVPATSLWHNLATSAARYPDKAALVFFGTTVSYRE